MLIKVNRWEEMKPIFCDNLSNNIFYLKEKFLKNLFNKEVNSTRLFFELVENHSLNFICENLYIHRGTVKRWLEQSKVPDNYYNDLNQLLNYKYPVQQQYRDKDQFYTKKNISLSCYKKSLEILKNYQFHLEDYYFIEPSAGCCNFYSLFPKNRRIGIDIDPKKSKNIIKINYLDYTPKNKLPYIVIGNPPFGLRGNLALRFINHSYPFADAVCFILPQLFNSDGKGVAKTRVKGYKLAYTESLPLNSFEYPNGKEVNIATVFQVWLKKNTHLIKKEEKYTCNSFIKIYSLSNGGTPSSTRNKHMIDNCDVYLPSTTFKKVICSMNYKDLPHNRGYGIVFLKKKKELKRLFLSTNWNKQAFLSTNSALNLRFSIIKKVIIENGYRD